MPDITVRGPSRSFHRAKSRSAGIGIGAVHQSGTVDLDFRWMKPDSEGNSEWISFWSQMTPNNARWVAKQLLTFALMAEGKEVPETMVVELDKDEKMYRT